MNNNNDKNFILLLHGNGHASSVRDMASEKLQRIITNTFIAIIQSLYA